MTSYADLNHWLDQATRGVPRRWAASIRAELTAHFEDATAALLQQDVPEETAHRRALAALGDPHEVAHGFNDVHRGRRHYLIAALVCLLLLVENFDLPQRFLMADWADGSTPGRLFYAADHAFTIALSFYVVFVMGRLLVWRFDHAAANTPVTIILGGLVPHAIGTVILDLAVDTGSTSPTLLNASNLVEGIGAALQGGGVLLAGAGLIALGTSVLLAFDAPGKGIALLAIVEGATSVLFIIALYLSGNFLGIYVVSVLNSTILLPAIGVVFMRAWLSHRRLSARAA